MVAWRIFARYSMREFFAKYKTLGWTLLVLSIIIIYLIQDALRPEAVLPVYQPAQFDPSLVDSTVTHIKRYHTIADFSLTNQNGQTVTQDFYKDKIYVADFFFTTCPTICPIMTKNMALLQQELLNDKDVLLLSHTVTPDIDSVPQLKKYAEEKGVIDSKWNLVTGEKKQIYELARKSYLAAKSNGDGGPFDMIHTENFILVDKEKRIRGTYDGTNKEAMYELLEDIRILQNSYQE